MLNQVPRMKLTSIEDESQYELIPLKEIPKGKVKSKVKFSDEAVINTGVAETCPSEIKTENVDTRIEMDSGVVIDNTAIGNASHNSSQPVASFYSLWGVCFVDIVAPLVALGGTYLLILGPRLWQRKSGNLGEAKQSYVANILACLLQLVMGVILLLKLMQKIFSNFTLSGCLYMYNLLSIVVAALQAFVLVSPFFFNMEDKTVTGDGFNSLIVFQATVMLCLRIPLFGAVATILTVYGDQI